jgi:hypothetical protein
MEEVGAITKAVPLDDGRVIPLCAFLEVEHRSAQGILRGARRFHTDKENVRALRQQLAQFVADQIGETLLKVWLYSSRIRLVRERSRATLGRSQSCDFDHEDNRWYGRPRNPDCALLQPVAVRIQD